MIDPQLKSDEMKVRISGNVTLLTNGGNRSYYFLDTFNRRDGKWQIIATHFSQTPQQNAENVEQTIMQTERDFIAMTLRKDAAGLARIVAEDFSGVESSGRVVDRIQFTNDVKSGIVQTNTPEDLKVRIYGDTAIVTGRLLTKGKGNDADNNLQLLLTDVWAKRGGQWQIVNRQITQIK
jgi:ketosteroid isomerase-like protein